MSKALKIAAAVVAVVAITVATAGIGTAPAIAASSTAIGATTFGLAGVAATGASIFGLSAAALTTIAGGLSLASSVLAKPPKVGSTGGSQVDWKADPNAGVPYAMGRTLNAGNIVHRASYGGTDNPYESIVTIYSASGPIDSIESVLLDGDGQTIGGGGALGGAYAGYAWVSTQLGAQPEGAALAGPFGTFPGWNAASKLSGKMAALTTFKFDKDGKKFPGGEPKQAIVAKWVKVYDPRLDSTYPGGSGAHRSNNEATWAWSQNPWLHALAWALGRYENGVRTVGVGIAPSGIDIAAYVEAANVADANSWALGGVIYSSDDKWNAIKQMAQAGGGEPIRRGGLLSAFVNKPRTSLLTIGEDDTTGDVKSTAMQSRRNRVNGIVPTFRSEANDWQMVPGTVVRSSTYLAEDGALRTRELPFELVQDAAQAGQLAAYALANGRELQPITVPCKPYMLQVRSGDAVTLNIPSAGLANQLVVVLRREIDFANATVTLICRSETTAKHAYALGQSTTPPATPSLTATGNPIVQLPWAAMVGAGKPDDNATASDNEVPNASLATSDVPWSLTGGAVRQAASAGDPSPGRIAFPPASPAVAAASVNGFTPVAIGDIKRRFVSGYAFREAGVTGSPTFLAIIFYYNAIGTYLGQSSASILPAAGAWTAFSFPLDPDVAFAASIATYAAQVYAINAGGALYVSSLRVAKTAGGATRNRWYVATSDPGGADGDGWKDISTTPAKFKLKAAGSWIDVSSLVTDTAQITDGANLGLTALWAGVVGSAKPEDYADVTLLVTGSKTTQVAFDYTGIAKAGQLPLDANFKLISAANTDVTTAAAWSATLKSGTATYSIGAATGTLNVTALATDAVIEVTAVYGGKTRTGALTLVKSVDAPPVGGGGGGGSNPGTTATTSTIANTASSSYGSANAGPITCKAGTAGQVACSISDIFYRSANGTSGAYGKVQWRVVGGTWADIASENISSANAVKVGGAEPENDAGNLDVSATKSGLTAGTDYEFQLLLRGSNSATLSHLGTFAAVGS